MARHVAFLRAINVGGHVVAMERLRDIFGSGLKLANVETFIASGNVVFETRTKDLDALAARIARRLEDELGYAVATFLRSEAELHAVAARCAGSPTLSAAPTLNVGFLAAPLAAADRTRLKALESDIDRFEVEGREVYWLCQLKQSESKFSNAVFEKALGVSSTFRGANTIARLAAKLASSR